VEKFFRLTIPCVSFAHLQTQIRVERGRHGLDEIKQNGGPSPNWIRRMMQARPGQEWPIRPGTLGEVDAGFGWDDGTAAELYYRTAEREVTVRDVPGFAQLLGEYVINGLATRLRIGVELADAAEAS